MATRMNWHPVRKNTWEAEHNGIWWLIEHNSGGFVLWRMPDRSDQATWLGRGCYGDLATAQRRAVEFATC